MKRLSCLCLSALLLAFAGCTGSTDGGDGAQDAQTISPFVSDGGAGGTLTLEIDGVDNNTIGVGEKAAFRVHVTQADGSPAAFARIFCDTEQGVAIIEPAQGGISEEATNADGFMSGFIGGVAPGSYLMECRAEQGFNLLDRVHILVAGTVPAGFQGFPGAAGGNLGGGTIVNETPGVDSGTGLRVTSFTIKDAGVSPTGPVDIVKDTCVDQSADHCTVTCTGEPFTFTRYNINIKNDTNENAFIQTVEFRVGGATVVSAQGQAVEVKSAGGTALITGQLTSTVNCSEDICYNFGNGSTLPIPPGSRNHTIIITGVTEAGNSFEITKDVTIQFEDVNNCSGGTPEDTCPTIPAICLTTTTTAST